MLTVRRILLVVTAGLILAGAVSSVLPWAGSDAASASDSGPEMRLTIKEGGACEGDTCTIPQGGSFTLAVEIVAIPDGGYILLQSFIVFGLDLVYQPPEVWNSVYTNPDCVPTVTVGITTAAGTLVHGCLTGLIPPLQPSTYTGNYIELKLNCPDADSTTEVQLLPHGDPVAGTNGSAFKRPDNTLVVPKVSNLTINCGSGTPLPDTLTPTNSPTPDSGNAEMRLVVKEGGACDGDTCTVPQGASFTLAVEIVAIPEGGWVLAQSFIVYGPDLIYHQPDRTSDEYTSPDCVSTVHVLSSLPQGQLLHGCLTGLIPPLQPSTYTGNYIELKMTCSDSDSSTEVQLLPFGDPVARTNGTLFKLSDNSNVVPKVSNLTVNCGSGQGPTNTPRPFTETPSPTLTSTPTPNRFVTGDANCDGAADAMDASLILRLDAGLLGALPCGEKADVNGDGLLNSLDAALILQFTAGLIQQLPAGNIE